MMSQFLMETVKNDLADRAPTVTAQDARCTMFLIPKIMKLMYTDELYIHSITNDLQKVLF